MVALRVVASPGHDDEVVAVLWELGTLGIETRETDMVAWFAPSDALGPAVRAALGSLAVDVEPVELPEVDWVARFRETFRSFRAGSFLIAPSWDEAAPRDERTLLVEPGQAFGTGTHETTRLCLGGLESLAAVRPLGRVLDYGCGTALLAIAARRLGARSATGVDIDPDALDNARDHRRVNDAAVHLVLGDGAAPFRPASFDTIVANVTAPLLRARRDEISALRAPSARLVLSGLLVEELDEITGVYATLGAVERRTDGEWGALLVQP